MLILQFLFKHDLRSSLLPTYFGQTATTEVEVEVSSTRLCDLLVEASQEELAPKFK